MNFIAVGSHAVMALVMAIIYYFINRLIIFKFSGLTEPEGVFLLYNFYI
jgi:hypothetical protein